MVEDQMKAFPCSGEINFHVADAQKSIDRVLHRYAVHNLLLEFTDGVSLKFREWRFNLRGSNTKPLLRLNVESRRNTELMWEKTDEISALLTAP